MLGQSHRRTTRRLVGRVISWLHGQFAELEERCTLTIVVALDLRVRTLGHRGRSQAFRVSHDAQLSAVAGCSR